MRSVISDAHVAGNDGLLFDSAVCGRRNSARLLAENDENLGRAEALASARPPLIPGKEGTPMRQKRFSLFQLLLAAALTAAVVLAAGALAVNYLLGGAGGRSLVEAWHLINTRFVGEYDQDAVIDGALEEIGRAHV